MSGHFSSHYIFHEMPVVTGQVFGVDGGGGLLQEKAGCYRVN